MSSDDSTKTNNELIYSKINKLMTSRRHAPPSDSLMMSEDNLSEVEMAADGSRLYKPKSVRSQTNSQKMYHFDTRSQYDRSVWRRRDPSHMSVRSIRTLDLSDTESIKMCLQQTLENVVYPLEEMLQQAESRHPLRKRRPMRYFGRHSEENTDVSSEDDRCSTRSEFPIRRMKHWRHMMQPYARKYGNCSQIYRGRSNSSTCSEIYRGRSNNRFQISSIAEPVRQLEKENIVIQNTHYKPIHQPEKENIIIQNTYSATKESQEHNFRKPNMLPATKKTGHVPLKPVADSSKDNEVTATIMKAPSKVINQSKRLSDVSEIPEITENMSNDSMKPSFIKRKLFTQTLDVAMEKNGEDSIGSESSVPDIYSSVPRPKRKPVGSVIQRPIIKRNIFENTGLEVNMRELIEQLVPQEKLNITTGLLQKNIARSSIHDAKANPIRNEDPINTIKQADQPAKKQPITESDYDSDIFGLKLKKLVDNKNQDKDITEQMRMATKKTEEQTPQSKLVKDTNTGKTKKVSKIIIDTPKLTEKTRNKKKDTPQDKTKKTGNNVNIESGAKITSTNNKKNSNNKNYPKNHNENIENILSSKTNTRQDLSGDDSLLDKSHGSKQKNKMNQLRNSLCNLMKPCNIVVTKLTQSFKDRKANSEEIINEKTPVNNSNIALDNNKANTGSSKPSKINKVHNNLKGNEKRSVPSNTKTAKTMNAEPHSAKKRSASNQSHKPSKLRKLQTGVNKRTTSFDKVASAKKHAESNKSDSEQDEEISFRLDIETNLQVDRTGTPNITNSSGEHGVRRSARKIVRPSRYFDYSIGNTPKATRCRNSSNSSRVRKREVSRDGLKVPAIENKRQRTASPTFTVSENGSPKKRLTQKQIQKCRDAERAALRRSPRNIAGKNVQTIPDKNVNVKKPYSKDIHDSFLDDSSANEFTNESLQRSRSFNSSSRIDNTKSSTNVISSVLKRSASQFIERPTKRKSRSPVKRNLLSKTTNARRQSPRIANTAAVSQTTSHLTKNLQKPQASKAVDSFLDDSSDDDLSKQAAKSVNSEVLVPTSKTIHMQNFSANPKDSGGAKNNPVIKSNTLLNNDKEIFKQPKAVIKAPVNTVKRSGQPNASLKIGRPRMNASLCSNISQTSVRKNVNRSGIPAKIMELFGSDLEAAMTDEELEGNEGPSGIRGRVNQLNRKGINRSNGRGRVPSPSRSDISIRSVMVKPSKSLVNRAAKNFSSTRATEVTQQESMYRYDPAMTSLTAHNPSFFRPTINSTNRTRFDDSVSVASAQSFRSFRSFSNKYNYTTLNFR